MAIIFVFAVAITIFGVTWLGTINGVRNALAELAQLKQYREALQKRILRAQLSAGMTK